MTRRTLLVLHTLGLAWMFGCTSSSKPKDVATSSESSESSDIHTITTSSSTTGSNSSSPTSSTSGTLHDSAQRPTKPGDTGRPDSGWFTLPGPGFDSTAYTTVGDTQDTG